ncbi:MAG: ROK family protein [Candidatus Paceibacterota bacterium]|jgi:predicted NBD/HSP70 family sugar kinase
MIITVDTGGTKTLVANFLEDGTIEQSIKFPTPNNQNEYTSQLLNTVTSQFGNKPADAIVVAAPGIIEDGVIIQSPNHLSWMKGFDIANSLKKSLGNIPIDVKNDANLGGIGAVRMLDSKPRLAIYIAIGTGIGSGIIINGNIDPNFSRSEIGHMFVEFNGTSQKWERFAAGSAIFRDFGKYARDITDQNTWDEIADRISRGFTAFIPALQPDITIVGGGIGAHFDKYKDRLRTIIEEKLAPFITCPEIVQAQHTEEIVIYGCYYHARDILACQTIS